jgi:hypothetical protein
MKKQTLLIVLILSLTTIIAENPLELEISQGISNFTILEYFSPIYASELIQSNPEIQSISINDYGQTFGYLNTLGGIGTNFLIEPNRNYEIYTNQSTKIKLKY